MSSKSLIAMIGLISIAPFARAQGVPATSRITSSRSAASMMENPARGALESAKAPSVVIGLPSQPRTVVVVVCTAAMRAPLFRQDLVLREHLVLFLLGQDIPVLLVAIGQTQVFHRF